MNGLKSELFRDDPRLEKILLSDPAHVVLGDRGEFVSKIQFAALLLGGGCRRVRKISALSGSVKSQLEWL